MRWFNIRKMRKTFSEGALTYDDAKRIRDKKGMDMVEYLRARRQPRSIHPRFFRKRHFNT